MFRFSIRDLIWLAVVVVLLLGWWVGRDAQLRQIGDLERRGDKMELEAIHNSAKANYLEKLLKQKGVDYFPYPPVDAYLSSEWRDLSDKTAPSEVSPMFSN